jgi:hypothetical protein
MNARQARNVLRAYRPSGEDDHERDVREAVRIAGRTPALELDFHNQLAFDRALAARLEETPLPPDLAAALAEPALRLESKRTRRFTLRDPAMLAVGLAFLFLVGLLAWIFVGHGSFAGMDEVADLVSKADGAGPEQFSEFDAKAGTLDDWFVMKDFDGFVVPPGMESAPVVGVRLFKFEDTPVAAAAIAQPRALLYVLDGTSLGISLPEGRWNVSTYGGGKRAFAARQIGNMICILTLRAGGKPELEKYLATLP